MRFMLLNKRTKPKVKNVSEAGIPRVLVKLNLFLVHFLQRHGCPTLIMSCFSLTKFYEGYGQTECTAGCCLSLPGDWTAGMVGRRAISRDWCLRAGCLEMRSSLTGSLASLHSNA